MHVLFALPESSDAENLKDDQARVVAASGLSPLPHRSRAPFESSGHRGYRVYVRASEHRSTYQDSSEALGAHVMVLSPSVHTLGVFYAPLEQFIGKARLLYAWKQPDDVASVLSRCGGEEEYAILPTL